MKQRVLGPADQSGPGPRVSRSRLTDRALPKSECGLSNGVGVERESQVLTGPWHVLMARPHPRPFSEDSPNRLRSAVHLIAVGYRRRTMELAPHHKEACSADGHELAHPVDETDVGSFLNNNRVNPIVGDGVNHGPGGSDAQVFRRHGKQYTSWCILPT